MKIIAADDEKHALDSLIRAIREAAPDAELVAFQEPEDIIPYTETYGCDVAFLDIEMGTMSGIEVAKQLKQQNPQVNIIFVTGYDQYQNKAFHMRVSGYVFKPARAEEIKEELTYLRNPLPRTPEDTLVIKCFGNFNVFINGKEINFEKKKTKEFLAYLVDHEGESVSSGELRSVLWGGAYTDINTRSYLSKLKTDLVTTLKAAGIEDEILQTNWGKYSINKEKFSCDYYDYLDNKPEGIQNFNGEYMEQYGWAEGRKAFLLGKMR